MVSLQQKKAVAKTLFDLITHKKSIVASNDEQMLFYTCIEVLGLSEEATRDAFYKMNNGLYNFATIGQLDKTHQISFRNLMFQLITRKRTPSMLEKNDFNNILSIVPNPYSLPVEYNDFKNSHYCYDGSTLTDHDYEVLPWDHKWI